MWTLSIQGSQNSGLEPVDVVVQAKPDATVRDFAEALAGHLAARHPEITHVAPVTAGVPWPAGQLLAQCGLRNGDLLSVTPVPPGWAHLPGRPLRSRAVLRVVSGPGTGRTVTLAGEAATIGRGHGCTVAIDDDTVSRQHARVLLSGPQPVVIDEGSAAGTLIDGRPVNVPTPVPWGSAITLGATTVVLDPVRDGSEAERDSGVVLRPPRFGEPLAAETMEVPPAPTRQPRPHLPWAMLLLPLVMGVGLFSTGWNVGALALIVGWPAVMLLDYWLQLRQAAKEFAQELAVWREDLAQQLDQLDRHADAQLERARIDSPAIDDLRSRVLSRAATLWCRQPGTNDFLTCRIGLGPVPALVTGTVATGGDRTATSEARAELDRRRLLLDSPVAHRLGDSTVTAVTGPAQAVDAVVRALLVRLCADHSPVDVSLAAVLSQRRAYQETWLRWLPHTVRRTGGRSPVAIDGVDGQALLDVLAAEDHGHGVTICVIDEAAGVSRRRIEMLAAVAEQRRLYLIWLGASPTSVPSCTDTVLDLTAAIPAVAAVAATAVAGQPAVRPVACLGSRDRGSVAVLSEVDKLDLVTAWSLARTMHPYTDGVAVRPAETDLPERLRLPDLSADLADIDDAAMVRERWVASRGLRAQLGRGIDGVVTIDLREDGPHALIAGTTGAGKSELLQTLLCSLAVNSPPSRITFLLVDYKGGAAFRECAQLPHTVGYITDLDRAEVQRALVSLHAEITAREELLASYGVKDLVQMEAEHPDAAPPSLLVCVDEFAALTAEVPEFVEGMVNIAQRGRSLGVHLFLATQRPAGVVTANIQANTDLRIALRVASPDDSKDVLDLPDAADISRRTPGRAFLRRIGHGTTELVQVAWVGAREEVGNVAEPVTIRPFAATTSTPVVATGLLNPRTDLDRLVATVTTAFTSAASKRPKRPWLPPLQTVIPLSELQRTPVSGAATGSVPIGMVDEPRQQRQATLVVDYARVGHLLVYGASRAGKTELLRVVAVASALVDTAVPPHVYGIDFAGGALSGLRNWPSVATVVGQSELPRVMRLLRWLDRTVRQRNGLLADRNVRDLDQLPEADRPPRIHVLIDNLPALLGALEGNRIHLEHAELLTTVLQDGRRAGVHVTATAPSRVALPTDVQSAFAMRLVLRMSSGDDYDLLGVPANVLHADSPPGRGLLDRTEVQIAVVDAGVEGNGPAVRARMQGQPPVDVPAMPSRLSVHDLPAPVGGGVPLAVDANLVEPVTAPLRGNVLLVAGRRGSGRTSVLNGIAAQARRSSAPPDRIVMVTPGRPLPEGRDSGFVPTGSGWSLLLIDDAHLLERDEAGTLYELVKYVGEAVAAGWGVVVASDSDHARIEAGELVSLARSNRRGVLLQAEAVDDGLLGAELPFATVEPLSGRGRGLWCWDGLARVVHVVTA